MRICDQITNKQLRYSIIEWNRIVDFVRTFQEMIKTFPKTVDWATEEQKNVWRSYSPCLTLVSIKAKETDLEIVKSMLIALAYSEKNLPYDYAFLIHYLEYDSFYMQTINLDDF